MPVAERLFLTATHPPLAPLGRVPGPARGARSQLLRAILADRFQQPIPRRAPRRIHLDQRLVHELTQQIEDFVLTNDQRRTTNGKVVLALVVRRSPRAAAIAAVAAGAPFV